MRFISGTRTILILLLPLLGGCGAYPFDLLEGSVLSPAYWSEHNTAVRADQTRTDILILLEEGDPEQAQVMLLASRQNNIDQDKLQDLYAIVGNRLLQAAEQAATDEQWNRAGRLYRMALDIYPSGTRTGDGLRLGREQIDTRLDLCADRVMHQGLAAYRAGELVEAINIWQQIDSFHPGHRPSRIAITTTEQQLKNLEMISSENAL